MQEVNRDEKFYAMVSRTKLIDRWALMRNVERENVAEHSFEVAIFAHALALIRQEYFPELKPQVDPLLVMAKALFHDVSEVITGDLPTPVKYHDQRLETAYKDLEKLAVEDLLSLLPERLAKHYKNLLEEKSFNEYEDEVERTMAKLVKAGDKLSAFVKCINELNQGNQEFKEAYHSTKKKLESYEMPELDFFMEKFLKAFYLSLYVLKADDLASTDFEEAK